MGVDAHRFGGDGPLMIGTVRIDHPTGLAGHSDGDVVAHALCDALLSATGGPDIGAVFPSGDERWRGVSGEEMLRVVGDRVGGAGYRVVNAHAVVVCEAPRLSGYREEMCRSLTRIVGAPVTVHATTTDGQAFTEGVACHAVALVEEAS